MSFKAKLFIEDQERNILDAHLLYHRFSDLNGKPTSNPIGGPLRFSIESTGNDSLFYENMFSPSLQCQGEIIFYKRDGLSTLFKIEFANAHFLGLEENFSASGDEPLHMNITIGWGIIKVRGVVFEEYWNPNNPFLAQAAPTEIGVESPTISSIQWTENTSEETIKEATYGSNVALLGRIENPQGGSATVHIEKEDGTEFKKGVKQLTFEGTVSESGRIDISSIQIEEVWKEFKNVEKDKLIASINYENQKKKSSPLEILPAPKVIVHFRPRASWKGEYGFDWIRKGDTKLDGDVDYKTLVGKYGKVYATQPSAVFTKDEKKHKHLADNVFETITITDKKDSKGNTEDYSIPFLNLYKNPTDKNTYPAELEILSEVIDTEPVKIVLKYHKDFLKVTNAANTITEEADFKFIELEKKSVTSKTKKDGTVTTGKLNSEKLTIECIKNIDKDQYIEVLAVTKVDGKEEKTLAGKLKVLANHKGNRRIANVVFVNVLANINGEAKGKEPVGISSADIKSQKEYLSPFLRQALVQPNVKNTDLNLSGDAVLNKDYVLKFGSRNIFSKYNVTNSAGDDLVTYLKSQFTKDKANAIYKDYFVVFFLGNGGGREKASGKIVHLGGHANGIPSKECIMYKNPQPFFVAHELMHCMNLYHSFDNNGDYTFKIGQTENIMDYSHMTQYAGSKKITQISTWKWQWDILKTQTTEES